ncbi:hypothetical protein [Acrocarpospora sp. B8E8]|uniref:hypothetical protein n=1 Tax=Acrocarpospora sp. B8E8 TaxID=3153572 RepID=UPI00325E0868
MARTARTAKVAASKPMIHADEMTEARRPARAGPAMSELQMLVLKTALAAKRCSRGSSRANSACLLALPQACSKDEAANSVTYKAGSRAPRTWATGTAASRRPALSRHAHRPTTRLPTVLGRM